MTETDDSDQLAWLIEHDDHDEDNDELSPATSVETVYTDDRDTESGSSRDSFELANLDEEDESFAIAHSSSSPTSPVKNNSARLEISFLDVSIEKVREYVHSTNTVIRKPRMKVRISAAIIQVRLWKVKQGRISTHAEKLIFEFSKYFPESKKWQFLISIYV